MSPTQERLENQRHILQLRYILAKMRASEGKKQESDESQDEKRHGEELQQHCGKKTPHVLRKRKRMMRDGVYECFTHF